MKKQEKLDKIYEVIGYNQMYLDDCWWKVILIWDMFHYIKKDKERNSFRLWAITIGILNNRKYKNKALCEQQNECIDFIYNLVKW